MTPSIDSQISAVSVALRNVSATAKAEGWSTPQAELHRDQLRVAFATLKAAAIASAYERASNPKRTEAPR